jgi:hypothetical protein
MTSCSRGKELDQVAVGGTVSHWPVRTALRPAGSPMVIRCNGLMPIGRAGSWPAVCYRTIAPLLCPWAGNALASALAMAEARLAHP